MSVLSDREKIKFLQNSFLFMHLVEVEQEKLISLFKLVNYKKDQTIFEKGDEGNALYLVVEGKVKIHRDGIELLTLHSGDCLGEFAILLNEPRNASATAVDDTLLLKIEREDFDQFASTHIDLYRGMFKMLISKINSEADKRLEDARKQEQTNQDLKRAHEIQTFMLPERPPDMPNLEISAYYQPADEVGGDYYDFFQLPAGELILAIGDATGHGFYTGLMVAMVRSCLHTQIKSDASIPQVMQALNEMIHRFKATRTHMTFCYAIIDPKRYTVKLSDAGHNFPYHYASKSKTPKQLECISYPFGILANRPFPQIEAKFDKDDLLVFYTDGLTEAENSYGEQFGEERFERELMENDYLTADEIKDRILADHEKFCQGTKQADDITLVIIKVK